LQLWGPGRPELQQQVKGEGDGQGRRRTIDAILRAEEQGSSGSINVVGLPPGGIQSSSGAPGLGGPAALRVNASIAYRPVYSVNMEVPIHVHEEDSEEESEAGGGE
jgi:hypothetical protein